MADILTAPPIPSGQVPESILEEPLWKIRLRLTRRSIARNWKLFVANKIGLIGLGMIGVFALMAISHPILMATVWDPAVYNPVTGYHAVKVDKVGGRRRQRPDHRGRSRPPPASNPTRSSRSGTPFRFPSSRPRRASACESGTDRNGAEVSASHILGTDPLGRDVLSQLLYSTRAAFFLGMIAAVVTVFIATAIGSISAYFGGWIDTVLMRFRRPDPARAAVAGSDRRIGAVSRSACRSWAFSSVCSGGSAERPSSSSRRPCRFR